MYFTELFGEISTLTKWGVGVFKKLRFIVVNDGALGLWFLVDGSGSDRFEGYNKGPKCLWYDIIYFGMAPFFDDFGS